MPEDDQPGSSGRKLTSATSKTSATPAQASKAASRGRRSIQPASASGWAAAARAREPTGWAACFLLLNKWSTRFMLVGGRQQWKSIAAPPSRPAPQAGGLNQLSTPGKGLEL